jgi:hypothetical protein
MEDRQPPVDLPGTIDKLCHVDSFTVGKIPAVFAAPSGSLLLSYLLDHQYP